LDGFMPLKTHSGLAAGAAAGKVVPFPLKQVNK
jgi:hypothetical protein